MTYLLATIVILFLLLICCAFLSGTKAALQAQAKGMTREELADEILWAHAMGGEWEVYFEELNSRGDEDE